MPVPLLNRVALVTGSAKRLGRAIALRLAQEGADIVLHFLLSWEEAQETAQEVRRIGRRVIIRKAELTKPKDIEHLIAAAGEEFGRLDILVNNAAIFQENSVATTTESSWDLTLDTNLKAPFFCSQAAAPLLKQSGHGTIINMADIGGLLPWPGYTPHCVSKAGVIMLTRCLAKALAPEIRVNAIAPGTISMPGDPSEWEADYIRLAPLRRTGTPDDVAGAVSFLVHSNFITGQVIVVDGGRSL